MRIREWLWLPLWSALVGCTPPTPVRPEAPPTIETRGAVCVRDAAGAVTEVTFERDETYDADLTKLESFPAVHTLRLLGSVWDIQVTDAAVETIARLPALRELVLVNTLITDQGVARLEALRPKLRVTRYRGPDTERYFKSARNRSARKESVPRGSRE